MNYMHGIFSKIYLYNSYFFLDLQKIKNYKNSIIKKIRRNSIVAEKKKKIFSFLTILKKMYSILVAGISWQAMGILILILIFSFSISTKVTRIETRLETQLEPLLKADLPTKIVKAELNIENLRSIVKSQSDFLNNLVVQNLFYQLDYLKENTINSLNPEIEDGLNVFLEKMQEEEFIEINNSSKSEVHKIFEIIAKIGGIEKLMDLLETKDRNLAYGVVVLFVENYDFKKK